MSQVIIGDIIPYTQATATLGQTIFGTNWTANADSDVVVYRTPAGNSASDATQLLSASNYTIAYIGALQQVQVTLITPAGLADIITITRQTPADRENLYNNTNFTPSMLNNDFGILTLVDQQAQLVNQLIGPRYNYTATITPVVDTILPILKANEFWGKNATNTGFVAIDIAEIVGGGTVTQINTGLGLQGGPITTSGTISFDNINPNTFWANITNSPSLPTMVSTGYFLKSANNLSDLPNTSAARTNLGLQIGVNVEAWSAALDSIASLTTSANQMIYLSGSNTYVTMPAAANSILATNGLNVPSLTQTLPTAVQTNITQLGLQSQALNMNSHQINNVTDPTNPQDAATRAYVTAQTTGMFLPLVGGTMNGAINMGNHQINNITDPSSAQDAVTINYLNTQLNGYLAKSGGTMTGSINMNSLKITSVLDPTNPQDAATKNYVDTVATGLTVQPACYAATTANLTATYANGASGIGATLTNSGTLAAFTTDGQTPATNSRILVWNQSSALQNGIYVLTNTGSGAVAWILTRATDFDQPSEIKPGDLVIINNGTTYGGTSFIETATVSAVGTDAINFSQFTFSATSVLLKANNLSDVANKTTSFNNLSPLTTKGDLIGYSTQNVRLAVGGTNGQLLQVSSGAATGLVWSTATYPSTTTSNQLLYSSATNTVTGLATIAGGVLVTDASSVPSFLVNPGVAGKMLQSANAAIPAWSTPTYPSASGTLGKLLISDGTNNVYSTSTFPTSAGSTANKLLLSDGTNYVLSTPTFPNASATSGKMIVSDGTNWISSTPTFPNASATTRKIIVSDGTNWIASTETYATPGTSGNVLTSNGTNWISSPLSGSGTVNSGLINQLGYYASAGTAISGLTTNNNSILATSNTGVPSLTTTMPSAVQVAVASLNSGSSASGTTFWRGDGTWAIPTGTGINNVVMKVYNVSGTYTPTSGTKFTWYRCVGGGGSGGGASSGSSQAACGGGGGSGCYAEGIINSPSSISLTIGAGGAATGAAAGSAGGYTLISGFAQVGGGAAGGISAASGTVGSANGGVGGTYLSGSSLWALAGGPGGIGFTSTTAIGQSGFGGSNPLGQGGRQRVAGSGSGASAGISGTGYGSGSGGALAFGLVNAGNTAGQDGLIIFIDFL